MKRMVTLGIVVVAVVAMAPRSQPERFHLDLSRSVPDAYATVDTVSSIRLWFTEVPAGGTTSVRVDGPVRTRVATGEMIQDAGNGRVFTVPLGRMLEPGEYTVSWRATGMDGHVASGYFPFTVAAT